MNRSEHLQWAKQRALEFVNAGDDKQAFQSMMSDLTKHDELRDHPAIQIGLMLMMTDNVGNMRDFIEGFN